MTKILPMQSTSLHSKSIKKQKKIFIARKFLEIQKNFHKINNLIGCLKEALLLYITLNPTCSLPKGTSYNLGETLVLNHLNQGYIGQFKSTKKQIITHIFSELKNIMEALKQLRVLIREKNHILIRVFSHIKFVYGTLKNLGCII